MSGALFLFAVSALLGGIAGWLAVRYLEGWVRWGPALVALAMAGIMVLAARLTAGMEGLAYLVIATYCAVPAAMGAALPVLWSRMR